MRRCSWSKGYLLCLVVGLSALVHAAQPIPANHPYIQYFGRWDMSDSLHPRQSWPGTYILARFTGTSIGVRMTDGMNYYNVTIDGKLQTVFHGDKKGEADYLLADGLGAGPHTLVFSKRNIMFDEVFSFSGLLIDSAATLLEPPPMPDRKMEFIGDSFTAAESDEATAPQLAWEARFPVTNIDKGFAPIIARHYHAQYHTTCRSGSGMVCDWKGNREASLPRLFNRTLMESPEPRWNFARWVPGLVVICLGFNDYSGLKNAEGIVSDTGALLFRTTYHDFLSTIRRVYPGVRILAVAPHPEWIRQNVHEVVDEEIRKGKKDIFYAQFDEFPGGYVANGHPTVETHRKIADQIIGTIDQIGIFSAGSPAR